MSETDTTEQEYRVMWWSDEFARWFEYAPATTDSEIAAAWLKRAPYRRDRSVPVPVRLESRTVTAWRRRNVAPSAGSADAPREAGETLGGER